MDVLLVFVAVAAYHGLTNYTPAWFGARLGFWFSTVSTVYWSYAAVRGAFAHDWFELVLAVVIGTLCVLGMWGWSDELHRDRAKTEARS